MGVGAGVGVSMRVCVGVRVGICVGACQCQSQCVSKPECPCMYAAMRPGALVACAFMNVACFVLLGPTRGAQCQATLMLATLNTTGALVVSCCKRRPCGCQLICIHWIF